MRDTTCVNTWDVTHMNNTLLLTPGTPAAGPQASRGADRPPGQLRIWPIPPHLANSSLLELTFYYSVRQGPNAFFCSGYPVPASSTEKTTLSSLESESRSVVYDSSVTPWTIAHQVPLSMEFSRQEHCSGLPFPPPEDIPDPGIEPRSPAWQADS